MKVQHLTLGGNSVIRDTADILPSTQKHFRLISIEYKTQTVSIPDFPFRIKITATAEGVAFDLMRGGLPAVMNMCCFERENRDVILDLVRGFAEQFPVYNESKVIVPLKKHWLYSIIVNPYIPAELMPLAGETELYIYNELCHAKKNSQNS